MGASSYFVLDGKMKSTILDKSMPVPLLGVDSNDKVMFGLMWILELELARESGDPLLTYPDEFRDKSAAWGVLTFSSRVPDSFRAVAATLYRVGQKSQ